MNAQAILDKILEDAKENASAVLKDANDRAGAMRKATEERIATARANTEARAQEDAQAAAVRMGRMAELFRAPLTAGYQQDIYSLGRALEKRGSDKRALECFRASSHGLMAARASTSMSMMLKRRRALDEAMAVWRDMQARGLGGLMPYIELSKAYEHRLHDYRAALNEVERAQNMARALGDSAALEELRHRRERIIGKLAKQEE